MTIFIALISIYLLAGLTVVVRRFARVDACPICVGVAATWLWMFILRATGAALDESVILILMGGSVVGVAYWLERKTGVPSMRFKLVFIPAGMLATWALVASLWAVFLAACMVAVASLLTARFSGSPAQEARRVALRERMKECC
jgi:hypothetical protein